MLTDLIREFCKENDFKIYEDYSGRMMFGRKTIGITFEKKARKDGSRVLK